MHKSTFDSILLLGNHSNLYKEELQIQSGIKVNSLTFKKKDGFEEDMPHQFLLNDISIDFNGNYSLDELSFALSILINHNTSFKNCLIIGDPTELFYQAFCFAKTNQNPHLIRQEIQFKPKLSEDAFLFIYPCGMVAHNIRKEISSLIYLLKKHNRSTYLIREGEHTTLQILQNLLKKRRLSLDVFTLEGSGIEKLISSQEYFTS